MFPRIDFREIANPLGKSLPVHEKNIEMAVRDGGLRSKLHAAGHYMAVGRHDPEERSRRGRTVIDRERDDPVGISQSRSERDQAERQESAELFLTGPDFLDDLSADSGLALVDEVALEEPAVAARIFGPADIDSSNQAAGDRVALSPEVFRPSQALGEAMARSGADESKLEAGIQGFFVLEKAVYHFLDRSVPADDDKEV